MKKTHLVSLLTIITLFACKQKEGNINKKIEKETTSTNNNDDSTKELLFEEKIKKFSWNDISESNVDIGIYPYITPPKEMKINKSNSDTQSYDFHKLEMFDGNHFFNIEGRVDKMSIEMDPFDKPWNQYLFDTSIEKYLKSIGAKLISDKKIPNELINTWGKTSNEKYEHMNKFYVGDIINDKVKMFVLKTPTKKIGFQIHSNIATGSIGVVEMKEFKQTIKKITANDILKEIKSKGFATLHINFDTGKSRIKSGSYNLINEITKMMKANKDLKISIEGHTDNVGNQTSNLKLSKNRAKSVLLALTDENINESRLKSEGFGQNKPIANNATEEGKAKNRRVELRKI